MNTTNNCSEAKRELIPGMDMLIDHMKKQSLEIERLRQENKQLKEKYDKLERFADKDAEARFKLFEENKQLKDQIERERYEHNREIMKQQDTHYLEEVSPLEKQVEELSEENKRLKESNEFIRKTCLMADEENTKLKEQIDELGELCENIDKNAYNSWKKITGNEEEESSEEEGIEGLGLDWICYEFVKYNYDPEDGSIYDDLMNKIADWDDQGEGKMIWVDKKYEDKHKELAKKSMANLVAMATAPLN